MASITGMSGSDILARGEGAARFNFFASGIRIAKDMIASFDRFSDKRKFQAGSPLDLDKNSIDRDYEDIFTGIIDQGAGKNVVLQLVTGGSITFVGIGTGSIDRFTDLVTNASTRIIIS